MSASPKAARAFVCQQVEDVYRPESRALIERFCRDFLDEAQATPTELLFSVELQNRLMERGSLFQAVVQKVARAQLAAGESSASARIRELFTLADAVVADTRGNPAPKGPSAEAAQAGVERALAGMQQTPPNLPEGLAQAMAVGRLLTACLAWHPGWNAKLSLLCALHRPAFPRMAQEFLRDVIGEVLASGQAVSALMGDAGRFSEWIEDLALMLGVGPETFEVGWVRHLPGDAAAHAREALCDVLRAAEAPDLRAALLGHLRNRLGEPRSLVGGPPGVELDALIKLSRRLKQLLGPDQWIRVEPLLAKRFASFTGPEGLDDLAREKDSLAGEIEVFMTLLLSAVGEENQRTMLGFLARYLGKNEVLDRLRRSNIEPRDQLRMVTETAQAIQQSRLPSTFRDRLIAQLAEVQTALIQEIKKK